MFTIWSCESLAKGVHAARSHEVSHTRLQHGPPKSNSSSCPDNHSSISSSFWLRFVSCGADGGATFPFVDRLTRINKSTLPRRRNIYTQLSVLGAPEAKKPGDILFLYIIPARAPTYFIYCASAVG